MNCPYCNVEMEAGALYTQKVPVWKSKAVTDEFALSAVKHLTTNEISASYCRKCNKIIIDAAR